MKSFEECPAFESDREKFSMTREEFVDHMNNVVFSNLDKMDRRFFGIYCRQNFS